MISTTLESMLEEFVMPYENLLYKLKNKPSLSIIKEAIKVVDQYYYSYDIPHDKGLHIEYLNEIKMEIEKQFPKTKFPEYYL